MALYETRVVLNKDELIKTVTEKIASTLGYKHAFEKKVRLRSRFTDSGNSPTVEVFEGFSAEVAAEVKEILECAGTDMGISRFIRLETNGTVLDPTTLEPVICFNAVFI